MLKKFFADFKKYFKYTVEAAKASLMSEVANSYLNWIWWVLQPICFTFIFAFIFGAIFHTKEEYFIPFIVLGVAVWDFFNGMMKNSVRIIRTNKSIISKVYLPKFVLILVRIGVNGFKMIISLMIAVVAMIISGVKVSWRLFYIIPILIIFMLLCFALGCFLMHFGVYVADLENIVDIVLRLVFYITGVFYSLTRRIPEPWGKYLTYCNPVAYIADALRKVMLYRQTPNLKVMALWFAISLILSICGIALVYKNENSYVKSI
ncbi:MAG: ABC transporter permease [Lachnospiraceae bacterium]|nr:ABC transporter permease [Lachnospiraceae bacterium]